MCNVFVRCLLPVREERVYVRGARGERGERGARASAGRAARQLAPQPSQHGAQLPAARHALTAQHTPKISRVQLITQCSNPSALSTLFL